VALMMTNRIDFYPIDVALQHLGAVPFSVYNTSAPEQIAYVLDDSGCDVVVCEPQFLPRLFAAGAEPADIVVVDRGPDGLMSTGELMERGRANRSFDFEATWRAVAPDDVVTIVYTSGTTGDPKGVQLTHANLLHVGSCLHDVLGVRPGDRITSFLPAAHVADRFSTLYLQQAYGTQIWAVADIRNILPALREVRPTIWGAVPRIWEKLELAIEARAAGLLNGTGDDRTAILDVARRAGHALLHGNPVPDELRASYDEVSQSVLRPVLAELGLDQVRWALSGAAPIAPETLAFLCGAGVPITEVWGMSELSGIGTLTAPDKARFGTVGQPAPGMQARLADDGELLVRGPLLMRDYRNRPDATAEAIDANGWFHTGDVAAIDVDGYIRIVDRKKELIINRAGKNISPVNVENAIKAACPLVASAVAIGDARSFLTALLVLDADAAAIFAARNGFGTELPELTQDRRLIEVLASAVATANERLSRAEQVKRFVVLDSTWVPGGDELTPKFSLKRRQIAEKYASVIEDLYREPVAGFVHVPAGSAP
jgi:long-subunit acyl-CoA synthetase (AMP-forming)